MHGETLKNVSVYSHGHHRSHTKHRGI